MLPRTVNSIVITILFTVLFISCTSDKAIPDYQKFPDEIGEIIITRCAVPGCHDAQSKEAASGLSLESWNAMFEGYRGGAAVVPFRSDYSTLFFSVNTFPDLGIRLLPTMPLQKPPLTREQVKKLKDWIEAGAPDRDGNIKFTDNPLRKKYYVSNQGCDVVTVFDTETGLPIRYIDVGKTAANEAPHMIKVSPDGQYWYIIFLAAGVLQRYRTSDDSFSGEINIGSANWNTITITHDSKYAFCVDWSSNGKIAYVDLQNMSHVNWQGFTYPHGSAVNSTDDTLYATGQTGNFIYKVPVNDPTSTQQVSLQVGIAPSTNPVQPLDPHEIIFSPDGSKYFVTCQKTNEVRVIQTSNDQLLATISTAIYPQEMSLSPVFGYLFVSCPEDTLAFPGYRGAITVIDYTNNTFVKNIYPGYQPHGLAVDDDKKLVYVANRNVNPNGPAPHHTTTCGGRNGYVTVIDITTLTLLANKKTEVAADPYSVAIRK